MTSTPQIKANQANAIKSTGPVTAEGKEAVSQNARRHGLNSSRLMPHEMVAFEGFFAAYTKLYNPQTDVEQALTRRCAEYQVRIDRALATEDAFVRECIKRLVEENEGLEPQEALGLVFLDPRFAPKVSLVMRYQSQANRGYRQTQKELEKLIKEREEKEALAELIAQAEAAAAEAENEPSPQPAEPEQVVENGFVSVRQERLADLVFCKEAPCELPVQHVAE